LSGTHGFSAEARPAATNRGASAAIGNDGVISAEACRK